MTSEIDNVIPKKIKERGLGKKKDISMVSFPMGLRFAY